MAKRVVADKAKRNAGGRPRKYSDEILVAAALRVMEREGYAALTVRSLAKEVGTTHGTLYNYIGTIEEIEAKALQKLGEQLPIPRTASGPELRAELKAYLGAAQRLLLQHPGVLLSPPNSAAGRTLSEITQQWQRALQVHAQDERAGRLALGLITATIIVPLVRDLLIGNNAKLPPSKRQQNREATEMDLFLNEAIDLLLPGLSQSTAPKPSKPRRSKK